MGQEVIKKLNPNEFVYTFPEAEQRVKERGRFKYHKVAALGIIGTAMAKNQAEAIKIFFVGIPMMLITETVDSLASTEFRAKKYMKSYNQEAKHNFLCFIVLHDINYSFQHSRTDKSSISQE